MTRIRVTVERIDGLCNLPMLVGDHFFVEGSRLYVPGDGHICIWALQSMMPVFPALANRDRLDDSHWVRKVQRFQCPDPKGRVIFRLEVVGSDPG